jgi:hypothetical protein
MVSLTSADRETSWERRLHWEEVEEVTDRLRPLEHAGNCESRELDRGLQRQRGLKTDSPFQQPGTNRERDELQVRHGKFQEGIGERERRFAGRCLCRGSRDRARDQGLRRKGDGELRMALEDIERERILGRLR